MKKLIISTIVFIVVLTSTVFTIPEKDVYAGTIDTAAGIANIGLSGAASMLNSQNQGSSLIAQFFQFVSLPELINSAVASFVNWSMAAAGFLLSTAAYVLDVSINLTLHIKAFVEATPAVYSVWRILRDITGLFFIFYLLYAAIQMMTGFGKGGSYASTVKNIIIAGVLINFSFFIVSVSIDFSNVISQAIYNAMIPDEVLMRINPETNLAQMVANAGKSNISNIFMNSLRIQKIYDTNGNYLGANIADPIKMALIGIAGVVMMITTAASFILAALAFIARLIILIFLLAFSSLWFVGLIIPEVNKHFSMFQNQLFNQLIFMPAYLLLMYVALSIINGSKLLGEANIVGMSATGTNWIMPYVLIIVNFAIVIFILNLPLAVALGMGGMATGWLKKSITKWDALGVWKNIGGWAGNKAKSTAAYVPQNTVGYGAYMLNKSKTMGKIAGASPIIGTAVSQGLSKVSSATFGGAKGGYEGVLKARKKDLNTAYKNLENITDENTKAEAQKNFRTKLPQGILGHLFSHRANVEVSEKLIKDASKKAKKEKKPKNIKRLEEINRELDKLDRPEPGFAGGTRTPEAIAKQNADREKLIKEKEEVEKEIQDAIDTENAEKEGKILTKLEELQAKEEKK